MNSEFPQSPEDRLLDELLRQQNEGPDETFLRQIETAVDAGPPQMANLPKPRNHHRTAIAAGLGLAASVSFFYHLQSRDAENAVAMRAATVAEEKRKGELESLQLARAIEEQEQKVEEARKELATIVRTKGIIYRGQDSFYGKAGVDEDLAARGSTRSSTVDPNLPLLPPLASNEGKDFRDKESAGNMPGAGSGGGSGKGEASADVLAALDVRQARPRVVPPPSAARSQVDATPSQSRIAGNDAAPRGGFALPGDAVPEPPTGDRYGTFIDQPWRTPDRDPLSTFSIDVDTASYANVRRMIREGREIPRDAVRIEEFVNAFKYRYEAPKGDAPFAVGADLSVCPWAPEHQLVRVSIKGREIETGKRPASNLVFLIDVSGSMQSPDKLPLLKRSMETMVSQLDERDRVAIVVYAGSEGVALPSTRLDAEGRAKVLTALSKLDAGGSTNGGAGIRRAYEIAMEQKIAGGVNRVILATDGDFNVGVTGQEALVELVKDRAKGGVYLTVAGFGTGNLNDAMMDAITRDGNGNYFYIDSEREGRKVFLQDLSGTLVAIAKDVKIQVEFNPAKVGGYRLIGNANRVLRNEDFNNDKVDAGDIGAGHTVTAFYELTPPGAAVATDGLKYQAQAGQPAAGDEWLTVKLRYKHPEGDESRKIEFALTGEAKPLDQTGADFRFATAAALFGMKLRGMEEVRESAWDQIITLAKPGLADDLTEDRAEFVELVRKLAGQDRPKPSPAEIVPVDRSR